MIMFRRKGAIRRACWRSARHVIIGSLGLRGYQNRAAIIAWITAIIIHRPKMAIIMPTIIFSIVITSFLHIHALRPPSRQYQILGGVSIVGWSTLATICAVLSIPKWRLSYADMS
jgi:hypothetical protein